MPGDGDRSIQGFATSMSVNVGQRIDFKVKTDAASYRVDIYRTGYYRGDGARLMATVTPSARLPQRQPDCRVQPGTGLVDCGSWGVSAWWRVPPDAISGVYLARLRRADTGGASFIVFVVRDDARRPDVLVQTSDTTWQAYNEYGGASLYTSRSAGRKRAVKVSYNRPFATSRALGRDFYLGPEFALAQFLEANGYDVGYISGVDTDRFPGLLRRTRVFVSSGHDEYWSARQRANVESARDAGVSLAFFSGNEVYWRTRWEPSTVGPRTAQRTLVSYKDTYENKRIDPTGVWTGAWRDRRFTSDVTPENTLTGTMTFSRAGGSPIEVTAADAALRFWRGTDVARLKPGAVARLAADTLGYEFDEAPPHGQPDGLIRLSDTTREVPRYLADLGTTTRPATATHAMTLYRAASKALVFSAGTIQWPYGLGFPHDGPDVPPDRSMMQATVNLLADMGAQPATPLEQVTATSASTDTVPPTVTVGSPRQHSSVAGPTVTVTGTAADRGGRVAAVEVSTDAGRTWRAAAGRERWSAQVPLRGAGSRTILARAVDDSGNIGSPGPPLHLTAKCPCDALGTDEPEQLSDNDLTAARQGIHVGVRFRTSRTGLLTGVRFYKGLINTGRHVARLWTADGRLLAEAPFGAESEKGWQTVRFATPVPIEPHRTYTATYYAPVGGYASGPNPTAGPSASPITLIDGVYRYGRTPVMPTQTNPGTRYWVDVTFATTNNPDTRSPTVTTVTPANGAAAVPPLPDITVALDADIAPGWTLEVTDTDGRPVPGTAKWLPDARTIRYRPLEPLRPATRYNVTLRDVRDTAGNPTPQTNWHFMTDATPPPWGTPR